MRLFYQLSETEQNNVINHCADIVIDDLINDGVKIETFTEEDEEFKEKLVAAVEHIKIYSTREEKIDYLLDDPALSKAIYDVALELSKNAYYCDSDELVIFPELLDQEDIDEDEDDKLLPKSGIKISDLN